MGLLLRRIIACVHKLAHHTPVRGAGSQTQGKVPALLAGVRGQATANDALRHSQPRLLSLSEHERRDYRKS